MPVLCQYQPIIGRHWIRILRQLQTLIQKLLRSSNFEILPSLWLYPRRNNLSAFFSNQTVYYLATRAILQYPFIRSINRRIFKSIHWQLAGKAIGLDCEQVGTTWSHPVQPMPKSLLEEVDHVRLNHCKLQESKPGGNLQTPTTRSPPWSVTDSQWHW